MADQNAQSFWQQYWELRSRLAQLLPPAFRKPSRARAHVHYNYLTVDGDSYAAQRDDLLGFRGVTHKPLKNTLGLVMNIAQEALDYLAIGEYQRGWDLIVRENGKPPSLQNYLARKCKQPDEKRKKKKEQAPPALTLLNDLVEFANAHKQNALQLPEDAYWEAGLAAQMQQFNQLWSQLKLPEAQRHADRGVSANAYIKCKNRIGAYNKFKARWRSRFLRGLYKFVFQVPRARQIVALGNVVADYKTSMGALQNGDRAEQLQAIKKMRCTLGAAANVASQPALEQRVRDTQCFLCDWESDLRQAVSRSASRAARDDELLSANERRQVEAAAIKSMGELLRQRRYGDDFIPTLYSEARLAVQRLSLANRTQAEQYLLCLLHDIEDQYVPVILEIEAQMRYSKHVMAALTEEVSDFRINKNVHTELSKLAKQQRDCFDKIAPFVALSDELSQPDENQGESVGAESFRRAMLAILVRTRINAQRLFLSRLKELDRLTTHRWPDPAAQANMGVKECIGENVDDLKIFYRRIVALYLECYLTRGIFPFHMTHLFESITSDPTTFKRYKECAKSFEEGAGNATFDPHEEADVEMGHAKHRVVGQVKVGEFFLQDVPRLLEFIEGWTKEVWEWQKAFDQYVYQYPNGGSEESIRAFTALRPPFSPEATEKDGREFPKQCYEHPDYSDLNIHFREPDTTQSSVWYGWRGKTQWPSGEEQPIAVDEEIMDWLQKIMARNYEQYRGHFDEHLASSFLQSHQSLGGASPTRDEAFGDSMMGSSPEEGIVTDGNVAVQCVVESRGWSVRPPSVASASTSRRGSSTRFSRWGSDHAASDQEGLNREFGDQGGALGELAPPPPLGHTVRANPKPPANPRPRTPVLRFPSEASPIAAPPEDFRTPISSPPPRKKDCPGLLLGMLPSSCEADQQQFSQWARARRSLVGGSALFTLTKVGDRLSASQSKSPRAAAPPPLDIDIVPCTPPSPHRGHQGLPRTQSAPTFSLSFSEALAPALRPQRHSLSPTVSPTSPTSG